LINIFGAKAEQLLRRTFLMLFMADRTWQKSTKLWQLRQYLKPKFLCKISMQLLAKNLIECKKYFE
jgi:hypothetical protein